MYSKKLWRRDTTPAEMTESRVRRAKMRTPDKFHPVISNEMVWIKSGRKLCHGVHCSEKSVEACLNN